ncbi:hypothetical protein [Nonomuraea indica]|uniref:Uncharacterized protein n=1 Tax=Nonomuraea indica TaxID=1581193 RepID=A0ABW8A383_9ACTN|nr:hypothetical protein [Nonomuraea indica]
MARPILIGAQQAVPPIPAPDLRDISAPALRLAPNEWEYTT